MSNDMQSLKLPPGFNEALAIGTIFSSAPSADDPNTEGEDFINNCLDWLDSWSEDHADMDKSALTPCLLVFDPSKLHSEVIPASSRHRGFKHTVEFAIGNKVYACTSNLSEVHSINAPMADSSIALSYVDSLHLNQAYVVIWMPRESTALVVEPDGDIERPRRVKLKRQAIVDFDFTMLDKSLELFYEDYVATHEGICDVWKKAKERLIREYAERLISKSLFGFFRHSILPKSAKVDREIQTHHGREDIRIIRHNKLTKSLETAILELKVLRKSNTNEHALDWVMKGVDQARDYAKTDAQFKEKYVCIYDGRVNDDPMPDGVKYAEENEVKWRRYFMATPDNPKTQPGHMT